MCRFKIRSNKLLIMVLCMTALAISCTQYENSPAGTMSENSTTEKPDEMTPLGLEGLATFDETIPDSHSHSYYVYLETVEALTIESDLVFIGRITDYIESHIKVTSPEYLFGQIDIFDAIVFTVDEIVAGEVAQGDENQGKPKINLLNLALITDSQGTPTARVQESPIETLIPGIKQRNLPDGPSYLVFAERLNDPQSRLYGESNYGLITDASVVRVFEGGKLGVGAGSPLNVAVTSETDTNDASEPVNVLNLEDIRAATARAIEPTGSENSENNNPSADDQLNQSVPSTVQPKTG